MHDDFEKISEAPDESTLAASNAPSVGSKPSRSYLRLFGLLAAIGVLCILGVVVISGFVQGRQEAAVEAEREGPIKPPLRVKLPPRGEPIVTFDAATQKTIGLEMMTPTASHYH